MEKKGKLKKNACLGVLLTALLGENGGEIDAVTLASCRCRECYGDLAALTKEVNRAGGGDSGDAGSARNQSLI